MGIFICGFCLTEVEGDNYPDKCVCEMVKCINCGTWLKSRNGKNPKFCYGCGAVGPQSHAQFNSANNTSQCYVEEGWKKRNIGRDCKNIYYTMTGWKNVDSKKNGEPKSSWLAIRNDDGAFVDVRELTEEEKEILKR